ncbi:flavodoxin [Lactobacillus panisapium]|uniref:flavodoxin n=1 Tax=Lactobacillus panisapium TaxID=2012495 RepID=UPI001C6A522B|nr:flavodoxin [Lactobacillus panisapium]QYN55679.1 flavodoxin [Lactobacillus panisapium]
MKKNGIIAAFIIVILGVMGWNVYQHNQSSEQSAQPKSSSSKKQSAKVDRNTNKKDKILIVYFSRAGQNYGGSNLKIGNTHRIANYIAARTGGDKYEIVPAKKYPTSYQATADQAEKEQQNNARPKIKNALPDVSKYQTIFIGYPIWWNESPMIVRTFLEHVDLKDKQVVPFVTHGGSGFGDSLAILKRECPKAKFLKGFQIDGSQASHAQGKVNSWLDSIGF